MVANSKELGATGRWLPVLRNHKVDDVRRVH